MKVQTTSIVVIGSLLTVSASWQASNSLTGISTYQRETACPQVTGDKRPALLFVEDAAGEKYLSVSYQLAGALRREPVIAAKYIEVTQLDNSVFLVATSETPRIGSVFAMNFESGRARRLSATAGLRCLRAEPGRKTAMMVAFNRDAAEDRLVELDLLSFATSERYVLSRIQMGDEYERLGHPFKISPDFAHIAYLSRKGGPAVERASAFELRSLDLKTYTSTVLDDEVRAEIPDISSFAYGTPPFEWTSNTQLLYQHMVSDDNTSKEGIQTAFRLDGICVLKIVDIAIGRISECFRKRLRMELNGGSLEMNPLTGRVVLNRKYVVDSLQKQLIDHLFPFIVDSDVSKNNTEVRLGRDLLYSGSAMCLGTCLSRSGKSLAYALRSSGPGTADELFAVFDPNSRPVKVASGTFLPYPIGWID